jgi:pimeloyl-ACP methyl ester carboxylesterase
LLPALLALAAPGLAADRYQALDSCELSAAAGRMTATARCGRFEVAENPDDADSRRIELAYAVVPARNRGARPDPVFFLAGGPGQSARETLPMMRAALREVNRNRDLIFLDQRGTGGSNKLDCRFDDPENWLELDFEAIDQQPARLSAPVGR